MSVLLHRFGQPDRSAVPLVDGEPVGNPTAAAGPASVDDTEQTLAGGTWCYALDFTPTGARPTGTPYRVLIEVHGVPGPPDVPPVAAFEAFPDTGSIGDGSIDIFFGDASYDDDGVVVSYAWSFGDGATETTQNPDHVYAAPGTYTVSLVVTDDRGATASAAHAVVIGP